MEYVTKVSINIVTGDSNHTELIFIRTFSDILNFLIRLAPRQKQDFNQLFGFKYDPATQTPISGVSPQGNSTNQFHLFNLIVGVDLLDRLLSFDFRKRPTAAEALGELVQ